MQRAKRERYTYGFKVYTDQIPHLNTIASKKGISVAELARQVFDSLIAHHLERSDAEIYGSDRFADFSGDTLTDEERRAIIGE